MAKLNPPRKKLQSSMVEDLEKQADRYRHIAGSANDYQSTIEDLTVLPIKSERQELKYQSLIETMQEGLYLHEWVYDKGGKAVNYRIIDANPSSEKHLGIPVSKAVGSLATDLYEVKEAPFLERYWNVYLGGTSEKFIEYFGPLNRWFLISVFVPQKDRFATLFTDITREQEYARKLERSQSDLQRAQEITHIGSWYLELATNKVEWSPELFRIYGLDPSIEAPPYTEHMNLFAPESWEVLSAAVQNTHTTGEPYSLELRSVRKDGSLGWLWALGEVVRDDNGEAIGLWGAAQDITRQKESEKALEAATRKAEESERLKSAFLANMSHELRTPMNGIIGFTGLLRQPYISLKERKEYLDIIQKSGERMLDTINDIIDMSRIDSGLVELNAREFDLKVLVDDLVEFFTPEANRKGLSFTYHDELPENRSIISQDQPKLSSVLTNLIKNAIKFTDKGGITITLSYVDSEYFFKVSDTGIGIPEDRQQAVFNRFVQADVEDKNAREGSGLGLSIAQSYVKLMEGKIFLESVVGKGSSFTLVLPDLISTL